MYWLPATILVMPDSDVIFCGVGKIWPSHCPHTHTSPASVNRAPNDGAAQTCFTLTGTLVTTTGLVRYMLSKLSGSAVDQL